MKASLDIITADGVACPLNDLTTSGLNLGILPKLAACYSRQPFLCEVIQQIALDVFGTQEGLYEQLKDIANDLPDYDWVGLGRKGGSRAAFMAVFYCKARFEPLAFDHFWLSDTPEVVGSRTWGDKVAAHGNLGEVPRPANEAGVLPLEHPFRQRPADRTRKMNVGDTRSESACRSRIPRHDILLADSQYWEQDHNSDNKRTLIKP
jgi:hypothetical protein